MVDDDWDQPDDPEWIALGQSIRSTLNQYGRPWDFTTEAGDYFIVDDDWGSPLHQIEFQNLDLLRPHIVKALKDLLIDYPKWLITVRVDLPDKKLPGMGLAIYADRIVDELQRAYLPREFRTMRFDV